ncbi:MAG: phosphate/phosphite/phosphonate ABC transporter substrate-binding protein [Phycisphaerales bacterium]|nr:MAG: phosphate/phosphite/phosphonate ABC transporter substrate-binding protein [Phycisphaerales bacterium]
MRTIWISLTTLLVLLVLCLLFWLGRLPGEGANPDQASAEQEGTTKPTLRIGLIPERDIFEQRRRYKALADYLSEKLQREVALVTENTYEGILEDYAQQRVDAAFLGSLVSTLAMDRYAARPTLKPVMTGGVAAYRGVILVREDSPIRRVEDLAGHSIAMVRATTAGDLFPMSELMQRGLLRSSSPPQIKWVGTHDAVIREVWAGRVDAGSAKDLRLEAYEASHPERIFRRLVVSDSVPNNALLLSATVTEEVEAALRSAMSAMADDPAGSEVLKALDALRFVPCEAYEYEAVYRMVESLGEDWSLIEVSGPPPARRNGRTGEH